MAEGTNLTPNLHALGARDCRAHLARDWLQPAACQPASCPNLPNETNALTGGT